MKLEKIHKYVWDMSIELARSTYKIAVQTGNFWAQYLWYRPTNSMAPGQLCISAEKPGKCWELATNERIPYGLTTEDFGHWIQRIAQRLPILPMEE